MIASRAKRQFRRLPAEARDAINAAFADMSDNPFSGDVKSLGGSDGFRRRVRDWRILYKLDEDNKVIVVTAVRRRGSNTY